QGRTVYANQRMADMLGYTAAEMALLSVYDVCEEQDRERARALIDERLSGKSAQHDWRFTRKDGTHLWCIVNGAPLKDDHGAVIGVLGMITDISARKLAEDRARNLARLYAVS